MPESVREFYFPNGELTKAEDQEAERVEELLSKRGLVSDQEPVDLPGIGPVIGRQLLAAEQAHTLQLDLTKPGTYKWLGLHPDTLIDTYSAVHQNASEMADAAISAAETIRLAYGPVFTGPSPAVRGNAGWERSQFDDIVLTAALLSAAAHEGTYWIESSVAQRKDILLGKADLSVLSDGKQAWANPNANLFVALDPSQNVPDSQIDVGKLPKATKPSEAAAVRGVVEWKNREKFYPVTSFRHASIASTVLQASWDKHIGQDDIHRALHRARGFTHDTLGDRIHKDHTSFLDTDRLVVTPLVIQKLLLRLGVDVTLANEVAGDHLALTRGSGPEGMQDYPRFNDQAARRAGAVPTRLACSRVRMDYLMSIGQAAGSMEAESILDRAGRYAKSDNELLAKFSDMQGVEPRLVRFGFGIGRLTSSDIDAAIEATESQTLFGASGEDALGAAFKQAYGKIASK
jgi:hypothetical protein